MICMNERGSVGLVLGQLHERDRRVELVEVDRLGLRERDRLAARRCANANTGPWTERIVR